MLFQDWLKETRQLQIDSYGNDPTEITGEARDLYLMWNNFAAIKELGEASDEHSWKPWSKTKGELNRKNFIKEQVDVLHFIANMLLAAQCTDEELDEIYQAKMEVNRQRMANDYDNTNKCVSCRRALDDVEEAVKGSGICVLCA